MSTDCPRLFEVEALRDGRLEGKERARFERHLNTCRVCSTEARALEALGEALRVGPEPDELHARRERVRLLAAFDRSLVEHRSSRSPARRALVATPAVVLVAAVLSWWVWPRPERPLVAASAVVHASDAASWSRLADGSHELLQLEQGELWIHVAEGPRKRPLLVRLPDGELEDVGTTFSVTVENRRTIRVKVEEGRVLLRLEGRAPIALDAGDSWSAPDAAPARTAPSALPDPSERRAPARAPDPRLPSVRTTPVPSPAASEPLPDEASLDFKRAVATLNSGQPARAAAEFRRFAHAHPTDPRAEDAAYLRVIALQRAGNPDAKRAAAREYLQRHPSGFRRAEIERLAE